MTEQIANRKETLRFALRHLKAGSYAVVVLPKPEIVGTSKSALATWVYLRVAGGGALTHVKLKNP